MLRLQLAALAVADGRLPREQAAVAAASPGYSQPEVFVGPEGCE